MAQIIIADRFEVLGEWNHNLLFALDHGRCYEYAFQAIVMIKYTHTACKELLVNEEAVYKAMKGVKGFPTLRWSGEWEDSFCVIMDYMGCDFLQLKHGYSGSFDAETVAVYAVQMIECLKQMHSVGFIHGDIKPDNFTLGARDASTSRRVAESEGVAPMYCNPAFASIRTLLGCPLAKCDDLESLAYLILYLLLGDELPWVSMVKQHPRMSLYDQRILASTKITVVPEELCDGLPLVYAKFLRYARELGPDAQPDYDSFIKEFKDVHV